MTLQVHSDDISHKVETQRAQLWVATMAGNTSGDVISAHAEPIVYVPFDGISHNIPTHSLFDAQSRCDTEKLMFSPSATFSSIEGKRMRSELRHRSTEIEALEPFDLRTNFEHDRDRILHSSAFRRLAGKTQVYLDPDDHQRTRLTHALEVAQIAKAIARGLRLNEILAEAIALGHDCGHGPGGHASEDALDPYLPGGFNHAIFGADVTLRSLNLCEETLDGIRNHSWSLKTPMTPEGEIVSFADRIAYVCHDMEDALSCGLITASDFTPELKDFLGKSRGAQIDYFIRGVISGTLRSETIAIDRECGELLAAFRSFNLEHIYMHPHSQDQNVSVISTLRSLVDYFIEHPDSMSDMYRVDDDAPENRRVLAAVEYVAGMTDDYAYRMHAQFVK
jgi:dGTPase